MSNDTLYGLSTALQTAIEGGYTIDAETGEILWEPTDVDALNLAVADKAEAVMMVRKRYRDMAAAAKAEADRIHALQKMYEAKGARLKDYLLSCVEINGGAIETPKCRIGIRHSQRVNIIDEAEIPEAYIREKVSKSVDKIAVREALKNGEYVPGAALVTEKSISMR